MNNTIKKYWKNWLILLLVVLNLSTLATIWLNNRCYPAEETIVAGDDNRPLNGKCFIKNLDLTPEQTGPFRKINHRFRKKVCPLLLQLREQKNEMFRQLRQAPTDSLSLEETARRIGNLHYRLKKETVRFYLEVQQLCTPAQRQKLEHYFTPLFGTEGCVDSKGCRKGKCKSSENFNP